MRVIEYTTDQVKVQINDEIFSSSDIDKSGAGRKVYLFDTFVVKIQHCGLQNQREIQFYITDMDAEDAKYFPKLLACGTFDNVSYVIQERVFDTEPYTKKAKQDLDYLEKKYGLDDVYITNKIGKNENVAFTKDGVKFYDMGYYKKNA